jgi:UDP-N-acetylglucosamine--N-acetylmuramyl-(pentapeptide) pyrophosphoryl-undecaprenol N-acetylglucosamine transferase
VGVWVPGPSTNWVEKGPVPENIQLLWQTGKNYFEAIKTELAANDCRLPTADCRLLPFIDRMDLAYAAADIVVSRAGAIAISELCMAGKPVILVPSPNVAEDHQTKNAQALAGVQAALMVKDAEAEQSLGDTIRILVSDDALQSSLRINIRKMAIPDAAEKIAEEVMCLVPSARRGDSLKDHEKKGGSKDGS